MTRYNDYAKRIDAAARDALAVIVAADERVKRAEKLAQDANASHDARRIHHAKGDLLDAQDEVRAARKSAENTLEIIGGIRKELGAAIDRDNIVNESDVDAAAVELLRSGVMTPADYNAMANRFSSNRTMLRLCAKYAQDAAREAQSANDERMATDYRTLAVRVNESLSGRRYESGVEVIVDAFTRCIRNHAMIKDYPALTSDIVENF